MWCDGFKLRSRLRLQALGLLSLRLLLPLRLEFLLHGIWNTFENYFDVEIFHYIISELNWVLSFEFWALMKILEKTRAELSDAVHNTVHNCGLMQLWRLLHQQYCSHNCGCGLQFKTMDVSLSWCYHIRSITCYGDPKIRYVKYWIALQAISRGCIAYAISRSIIYIMKWYAAYDYKLKREWREIIA